MMQYSSLFVSNFLQFSTTSSFAHQSHDHCSAKKQVVDEETEKAYAGLKERIRFGINTTFENATQEPNMDKIVRNLFTKEDAEFLAKFPYKPYPVDKLAKKFSKKRKMPKEEFLRRIDDLLKSFYINSLFFFLKF